ncbi:MAG TPA: NADH:flavin oxidoreductase/NADH oxidase [Candidatus Limnocylindria bacterium]|nr:NADH:flavin oxidoreductase/NADH oxidase [Candidatus Limnocylindria bacterium]
MPTDDRATGLFTPLRVRGVTSRNRIMVSPMCQYSSVDGLANDWHLVHLGARAVGGAGLVVAEATAVEARGRISPADLGIWSDAHVPPLARIARSIERNGAVPGIQLAHAGRKASTKLPWLPGPRPLAPADGGWSPVVAPSPIPFGEGFPVPHELTTGEIADIIAAWAAAARRARDAGFKLIEIHAGHGYLLHEFFSPVANQRTDGYGGSFERRVRIGVEVVDAIRGEWPSDLPLFMRISATDWIDDRPSWTLADSIALARLVRDRGVDLIDCSSGSMLRSAAPPESPGYQVPFAEAIRREAGVLTAAVGVITHATQAQDIVATGKADVVALARAMLVDPYWPLHAARTLGVDVPWPDQYLRAKNTVVG